jgi:NAD(P)H-quinone oxidoreductase subunit 5
LLLIIYFTYFCMEGKVAISKTRNHPMTPLSIDTLLWCMPLIYLLSSFSAFLIRQETAWRVAESFAAVALIAPSTALLLAMTRPGPHADRADYVGMTMALLIAVLGWIIIRYSRCYLQGEPRQGRYVAAMTLTLASVATVAISDNLALIAVAWTTISFGLHHLLTFYSNRAAAQIVAHKKFVASRLADLCMAFALLLLYSGAGTLSLQELTFRAAGGTALPGTLQASVVLVALAAILKSAQLPVHGWLIQVMEAPTPVSALLHAGIVNLGGFVLIRLAQPLSAAPVAQTLLVVVGSMTAVLAGLVMMTRISIKVRLAWSTCAQMGFMLMECGLGLYDLAFLHLVAHSLYKAYAFLRAGEAVLDTRRLQVLPAKSTTAPAAVLPARLAAAPVALAATYFSFAAWRFVVPTVTVSPVVVVIVGLGLAPLLWREDGRVRGQLRGLISVAALAQLYIVWHIAFGALVAVPQAAASTSLIIWVGACFVLLYALQAWLLAFPQAALSKALYPWAYYGFYLDERFTRLTFRVWPVRLPDPAHRVALFRRLSGAQA